MTPLEAWNGKKPSVNHLKAFGSKAYAHIPSNQRSKLEPKSKKYIFVGYPSGCKGYRLIDPITQTVKVYRDVIFDERQGSSESNTVLIESEPVIQAKKESIIS